jgi:arylsulfatase A-like enzyme
VQTPKSNIVLIVSDTLRKAHLGCYGNQDIQTPNIDAFAKRAVRFTRAYPESLPTIPVRRALHTGRRAYPFRNYLPVKWDIVYLPGWQAMDNDEDTLAENLAAAGYQTGFVTDTLPYFAPGFNFQRGFWQWEFIRGQQQDRWRSPFAVSRERLSRYGNPEELQKNIHSLVPMHLANTADVKDESNTTTARTFKWAMDFIEDNRAGQPFYLMVDCFDPHEPWEAPENYFRLYGNTDYKGRRIVHCGYGPAEQFGYTPEEIDYVEAQYSGLVTLVDTWFGKFMAKLDELGLSEKTAVFFISDHGTNFCDNPRNIIGKPANAMYPGVMHLPLLVRLPDETGAGQVNDALIYNLDITATIYELAGLHSDQGIDGQSLTPLLTGRGSWKPRDYVTCRYGNSLCYIDEQYWILTNIDGQLQELFDLKSDPNCQSDVKDKVHLAIFESAWQRLLEDAGGSFPDYREQKRTDAIGQPAERDA